MKLSGQDAIHSAAMGYAARGWQVVMLHAPYQGGCTCTAGKACEAPGKHPRGKEWQHKATTGDEATLLEFFERWPLSNIGLLLGPRSGVIDVEFDSEQGRATADRFFKECYTPTYQSSRGTHRLFKWTSDLPAVTKQDVDGLEVWIGGQVDKATQSVMPPSLHASGALYRWLPGLSPDDVELIDLPAELVARLWNVGPGDERINETKPSARAIIGETISEGGRNDKLYKFACSQARRSPNIDDQREQSELLELLRAINVAQCQPPLGDEEIQKLWRSAIGFIRQQRSASGTRTTGYNVHGLVHESGEWWPGQWQLTIVLSDPPAYRLCVPAWKDFTIDGSGNVLMTVNQYRDPAKVAAAVQAATRNVILDEVPRVWPSIWNGREGKRASDDGPAKPARRGLKAKLLDGAKTENPPPTAKRYVVVADYLAEKINDAHTAERPDDGMGMPTRIRDEVWFKWRKVWQEGILTGHIAKPECDDLRSRLGLTPKDFQYYPSHGDGRSRYCVLSKDHLARLHQLTGGDDRLEQAQTPPGGDAT